jgi:hypothetical protein
MADTPLEKARAHRKAQHTTDFDPGHVEAPPEAADRIATAIEYMAFQLPLSKGHLRGAERRQPSLRLTFLPRTFLTVLPRT